VTPPSSSSPEILRKAILDLLNNPQAGKSISPTEAARSLTGSDERQWSRLMKPLRMVAVEMAKAGEIEILRKGKPVDPSQFRGVYRLALPSRSPDDTDS
jgi:hypothetical protein